MCYNTTDQLRKCTILSLKNTPIIYTLEFEGLHKNPDGFYSYADVISRFDESLEHYYDFYEEPAEKAA